MTTYQDPRVHKTRQAMSAAVMQLLEASSFAKITVNDVCKLAMVSRTTFYQHFQDKYDLVFYALEQAANELQKQTGGDLEASLSLLLEYMGEKRTVFRNLLLSERNDELLRMLAEKIIQDLCQDLEHSGADNEIPAEVLAVFLSGGMAALLLWWIKGDFGMSKEELTGHIMKLFFSDWN